MLLIFVVMDEYADIFCSVEKWCLLVSRLNSRQKKRFASTALEKLLLIPSVLMRKCLLKFIIKSYDLERKKFIMPSKNGAISLRTEDVFDIFGLQNKGKDAMKALGKGGLKLKVKVPSRFVDSNTGQMMIDQLIEHIVASGTYDDDFLRRIVLVLLGTVLAPHSTKEVPNAFYKLVEDVEAIKAFNWNAFTLRICIEGITKTQSDTTKFTWPVGNLALLQVNLTLYNCLMRVIFSKKTFANVLHVCAVLVLGESAATGVRDI